jgi:hypothetical protein
MGGSRRDVLLAVALGSRRQKKERLEQRLLPDRRSGIDRRKVSSTALTERRSGIERRQALRRRVDRDEGATLLEKARTRLTRLQGARIRRDDPGDGLR